MSAILNESDARWVEAGKALRVEFGARVEVCDARRAEAQGMLAITQAYDIRRPGEREMCFRVLRDSLARDRAVALVPKGSRWEQGVEVWAVSLGLAGLEEE